MRHVVLNKPQPQTNLQYVTYDMHKVTNSILLKISSYLNIYILVRHTLKPLKI